MIRYILTGLVFLLMLFGIPEPAYADNCGSLSDCYGVAIAAAIAGVAIPILLSLLLDFSPFGRVKGILEAILGRDLITGDKLAWWERLLNLIPGGRTASRTANTIDAVEDLARAGRGAANVADEIGDINRAADKARDATKAIDKSEDAAKTIDEAKNTAKAVNKARDVKTPSGGTIRDPGFEGRRPDDPWIGLQRSNIFELNDSNLQEMLNGRPPYGKDGQKVVLHHRAQQPNGPLDELTATQHQEQTKLLHGEDYSRIDRALFDQQRARYWVSRARQILKID